MEPEIVEGFRLSPQQKRLWRLQQIEDVPPYRAVCALAIRGALDAAILEQAFAIVIAHHEILRTAFRLLPGISVPVQVIEDEIAFSLGTEDMSSVGTDEQRARLESLWLGSIGDAVDTSQLPTLRAHLVALSPVEHRLLVSLPALGADRPSLARLGGQLAEAYAGLASGAGAPKFEGMQYADFAEWRNQLIEGDPGSAARAHWRQFASAAAVEPPSLPFEKVRAGSPDRFRPAALPVAISAAASARVAALAASRGLPVSSFVLACWQTLIWRLTGRADFVVGTAFDGRKPAELQGSIGLLSTFVPLRSAVADDQTLAGMWAKVAEDEREGHRWQEHFAWEDAGYFPFCFELHEPSPELAAAGLVFVTDRAYACTDRFKVKLVCEAGRDGLCASLEFDSSVLAVEDARRLAEQTGTLIEDASSRPDAALRDLTIIGAVERQRLLGFNASDSSPATGRVIHELFEEWSARTPDALAVVSEADQLTYGELNARANQLAHHLIASGVGPDVPVGLCVQRSTSLMVGLLGILKAGGAYVPLDPGLPKSRLSLILADAGAQVLVSTSALAESLGHQLRSVVRLDTDADLLSARSRSQPPRRVSGANLVYVIFTSGSTGRPKGVAVEHRHLVNYVEGISAALDVPAPKFAMISTVAADLGNTALFPALTSGGTLHLISEVRATDPDRLSEYFEQHGIDCLKIVPSHLNALLSGSHPARILPRRRLVLGGDVCSWSLVRRIETLAPGTVLFNHYGPTEATVGAIADRIDARRSDESSGGVPLGRPLANVRAYILDAQLRPAPTGVPGELYIGGRGVARGYVNRPDATAERFLPDAFSQEPGARIYRTGDRARYLRDGRVEFLGRADDQVKVNGYRVEPAEIDAALRAHAGLISSLVMARQDPAGETKLVAYVVARNGQAPPAAELRSFLRDRLPDYMIPSAFVFLDRLPLTANGKVDRRALPADYAREAHEGSFAAPRDAAEQTLVDIWAGVLGVPQVGVHDNFFELGGDSILSIQIIARANQAGLRLSPRQLFQHQTIAELAGVAGTTPAAAAPQGLVTGDVPLTPVQARFFELDAPAPDHYNQAVLLELDGAPAPELVERALHQILRHHDALRLRAAHPGDRWQQRIAPPDDATPFERIDLSALSVTDHRAALAGHAARLHGSLDLEAGPILRAALFDFGPARSPYLLIVIHHLAVDVVSWRILLEDLDGLLGQLRRGAALALPAKTTSFKAWADRITEHAQSKARQAELSHWLSLPRLAPGVPVDHRGGDNTAASARTVSLSLSADETDVLLHDVSVAYRTQINEVLLTALVRVLAPWTGSPSVLLDLEGHGREEILDAIDLSRTVGWFTTIFPVCLDGGDAPTPAETIKVVKEQLRAVPDRGIGYGLLRYASGDPAIADRLRSLAQPQVRFNYLGRTDRALPEAPMFRIAEAPSGPAQSSSFPRTYLVNIIASVSGGALRVEWTYSGAVHDRPTVERLAHHYLEQLRLLIAGRHALAPVSLTPSDFSAARLSQEDLDKVLARMRGPAR
ncbi:MAG: amino acid adenylation domain-containing protein [Vicinamibacterales bacterium]